MAATPFTGLEPHRLTGVTVTDRVLGHGAYAVVREVEYMGLKCAGKQVHGELLSHGYDVRRFERECSISSRLTHPNLVQFLGVYMQRGVLAPMLIMEYLPYNLSSWIDQYGALKSEISYSILHDVALGLCYLHSQIPPIVHRDLSSNNVLLTANMTAKISDLATARNIDSDIPEERLTGCPGTPAFSAPETLVANPKYDASIDVFSYGIIMIHVFSGEWPEPQVPAVHTEPEGMLLPVSESERREVFLKKIGEKHLLMGLILACISNDPRARPPASEVARGIAMMDDPFTTYRKILLRTDAPQEGRKDIKGTVTTDELVIQKERLLEEIRQLRQRIQELRTTADSKEVPALTHPGIAEQIPGVEVCGETRVFITNAQQFFHWRQFGLKLHFQQDSLPSEVEQCIIDVMVSVSGQYEFPQDTNCVSAVFWFRSNPPCRFQKPITVEMEHCAKSSGMLCFARAHCTQESLPFRFEKLPNGSFSNLSSYGVLQLNSFSGIGVVNEGPNEKEYCARIFYMNPEIHFIITCNTSAHNTALQNVYQARGAAPGPFQPVNFESDEVMLDIPMDGVTVKGWTIIPLVYPVVTKRQVDSFSPGKLPPCCQLHTEVSPGVMRVASVYHKVMLIGASRPHNIFTIVLPIQGLPQLGRSQNLDDFQISHFSDFSGVQTTRRQNFSDEKESSLPLGEDDLSDIMHEIISVKARFYAVGRALGLSLGELNAIRQANAQDVEQGLNDVLVQWLHQKYNIEKFGLPTWKRLIDAVDNPAGGNNPALAQHIASRHLTVHESRVTTVTPQNSRIDESTGLSSMRSDESRSATPPKSREDNESRAATSLISSSDHSGQTSRFQYELVQQYEDQMSLFDYRQTLASSYLSLVDKAPWPPINVPDFVNVHLTYMKSSHETQSIAYQEVFENLPQVKLVLFTGKPGSGKSVLMTKLCQDWAKGLLLQSRLLFFVRLRELNAFQDHSLATLIHVACPSLKREEIAYLEGAIMKMRGRNVVFAFDGIDEYFARSSNAVVSQLLDVYRSFLPEALVVASSRPRWSSFSVGMRVEIKGFSSEDVFQYINGSFDDKDKAQQLKLYLQEHSDIMDLCYVPLHCAVVSFCYNDATVLSKSITEFYKCFTLSFFCSLHKDNQKMFLTSPLNQLPSKDAEEFLEVCKLAYESSLNTNYAFCSSESPSSSDATEMNENAFYSIVRRHYFKNNSSGDKLLSMYQHYLAAYYIATLSHSEQINVIMRNLRCPYSVYRFLCGMTDFALSSTHYVDVFQAIYSIVKSRNDGWEALLQCAHESKQQHPYDFLSKVWDGIYMFSSNLTSLSLSTSLALASLLNNPRFHLAVFHDFCSTSKEIVRSIFCLVNNPALSVEVRSYSCGEILAGIADSNTGSISLKLYGKPYLYESQKEISAFEIGFTPSACTKFKELSIHGTIHADMAKVVSSHLGHCINLQKLNIHGCKSIHARQVCIALQHMANLQQIKIFGLKFDDISLFVDCLKHCRDLSVMDLGGLQLKTFGAQLLGQSLVNHCTQLQTLYLDSNDVGDDGFKALFPWFQSCPDLELLTLTGNGLSDESVPQLIELIRTKQRLKILKIHSIRDSFSDTGHRKVKEAALIANISTV